MRKLVIKIALLALGVVLFTAGMVLLLAYLGYQPIASRLPTEFTQWTVSAKGTTMSSPAGSCALVLLALSVACFVRFWNERFR